MTVDRERVARELEDLLVTDFLVDREKLTPQTHFFEDLQLDSLDLMTAVSALEERYEISIPDEDLVEMLTVEKCIDQISARLEAVA